MVSAVEGGMNDAYIIFFNELAQVKNVPEPLHVDSVVRYPHCPDRVGYVSIVATADDNDTIAQLVQDVDLVEKDPLSAVAVVFGYNE